MATGLGNDGANEGFWRFQIRDKNGRWVKMGGAVTFSTLHPNYGQVSGSGTFAGGSRPDHAMIKLSKHPTLGDITIEVPAKDIEAVKAIIRMDAPGLAKARKLDALDGETVQEPLEKAIIEVEQQERIKAITGAKALAKIKSAAGLKAKQDEGRFPIPRSGADIRAVAKEQYAGVFDTLKTAYPKLVEDFPDYDSFWQYAQKDMAVTTTTQYRDSVDEIPELMRRTNEIYAKKVLGLNSEGTITFYRNATNNSGSTEKSAAGYASMDPNMAYGYNWNKGNEFGNGRYEIDAKPGEVYGLLGLSDAEDEYGVAIGPDVTRNSARRVGDLAAPEVAPWITPDMFDSGGGGDGPFRFFRTSGNFEFIALDEELLSGDTYADFYAANGLEQGAIPAKFDELYGAGAFEEMRGASGTPSYGRMKSYFMETPDGKYGLNPLELDKLLQTPVPIAEYDQMDTTLKMLSTMQELTGKPFMVHRGHSEKDPRIADVVAKTGIFNEYGTANVNAAEKTPLTDLGFDPEEEIVIYRGVPIEAEGINSGDWVTTLPQLAKDYAGFGGKVVSIKVKAKDLLADPSSGEGAYTEEMIYRPSQDTPGVIDVVDKTAEERGTVDATTGWSDVSGIQGRGDSALLDKGLTKDRITYGDFTDPVPGMDAEMFTSEQRMALRDYTSTAYRYINKLLRSGEANESLRSILEKEIIDIDSAIEDNGILDTPARVFRGMTIKPRTEPEDTGTDWAAVMENLEVGDVFSDKGYMSTSNDPFISHVGFASGAATERLPFDTEGAPSNNSIASSTGTIFWAIDLPAGTKALAIPQEFGVAGDEKEVLLARGTGLKVIAIRRVKQVRDDGIDAYNYYIEAEAVNE